MSESSGGDPATEPDGHSDTSERPARAVPQPPVVEARAAGLDNRGHVRRTRAGALWVGLTAAAVLAVLFLIFIAQNSAEVTIHYLGFDGQLSLAVALLLAAVIGMLLVAVPGAARIIQLRLALRKNARASGGHSAD